jgi:hypothetical protein
MDATEVELLFDAAPPVRSGVVLIVRIGRSEKVQIELPVFRERIDVTLGPFQDPVATFIPQQLFWSTRWP